MTKTPKTTFALPKILAPVGHWEVLKTAVKAGADEVYFGVRELNMRRLGSKNFELEDLPKIASFCQEHGVKTNLTVNVVLFDQDMETMKKILDTAKDSGIDAVIMMDFAGIQYARSIDLSVHISVQAGVANYQAVQFYSQFADRIVLARECDLSMQAGIIRQIRSNKLRGPKGNLVEIEVFAHGALCTAISGKCGMSLLMYNKSANRGECLQPCRRKYTITDQSNGEKLDLDNEYVMSSGDLATIGLLDQIVDSGVNVLKIEGRGRPSEYVDTVIRTYKAALEDITNRQWNEQKIDQYKSELSKVFHRGLTTGYYLGKEIKEWSNSYGSSASCQKSFVGTVLNIDNDGKWARLKLESSDISLGQELLIMGKESGLVRFEVGKQKLENGEQTDTSNKGEIVTIDTPEPVQAQDKVYKLVPKS
jgi:U32 family peptidase